MVEFLSLAVYDYRSKPPNSLKYLLAASSYYPEKAEVPLTYTTA